MRVDHRISVNTSAQDQADLAALGIEVGLDEFVTFTLPESDPRWPAVEAWRSARRAGEVVTAHFTKAEIAGADWLELTPNWFHGYPEPDSDNFGYRLATYDDSDFCEACGVGLRQVAPFQMAREPKWGTRSLLQLHWVYDEFFARPELYTEVFARFGVAEREVLGPRRAPLTTVVQLVPSATVAIETEGLAFEECPTCRARKYVHPENEASPRLVAPPPDVHLARSEAWFGTGAEAHHLVYVSQALGQALLAAKVKGANLRPATR